jgi:hypothetical protein
MAPTEQDKEGVLEEDVSASGDDVGVADTVTATVIADTSVIAVVILSPSESSVAEMVLQLGMIEERLYGKMRPLSAPPPARAGGDVLCLTVFMVVGTTVGDCVVRPSVAGSPVTTAEVVGRPSVEGSAVTAAEILFFGLLVPDELPPTAATSAFFAFCA